MNEKNCKECLHFEACCKWTDFPKQCGIPVCSRFSDVVPKSEYDAVVSAVDNSTQQFLKLHDDYQEAKREVDKWKQLFYDAKKTIGENAQRGLQVTLEEIEKAKTEVAREIFEEIEKYKRSPMPECKPVYVINYSSFAELKKKYTEDKT